MIHILLVEDDENDKIIFTRLVGRLKSLSFNVSWVKSLFEAKEALSKNQFDLIISDIGLPDCESIHDLAKIKQDLTQAPVIILTGQDDDSLLSEATQIGVYDYLVKSDLTPGVLRRSIRYSIKRFEANKEKKRLEAQLRQSQRIDALGQLTGGIAHDFNNKLAIMLANIEIAKSMEPSQRIATCLKNMEKTVNTSAELTKQLLAFGRKQELVKECMDMNQVVGDILSMLTRLVPKNIELKFVSSEEELFANVDPSQLDQVIMNLVVNARDSISEKMGTIEVRVTKEVLEQQAIPISLPLKNGAFICLSIKDSGCGMSEEVLSKVFEPFFSTKPISEGTGLGLSVVDGIVSQLDGFIDIQSEEGVGTCVKVFFPQAIGKALKTTKVTQKTEVVVGQRVLYVEDEEELRSLTTAILETKGFEVIAAADGEEALAIFLQRGQEIDVVLTDAIMPKMGGKELLKKLRQVDPQIGVVFVSGYSESELASEGSFPERTRFHSKPGNINDMIESLLILSQHRAQQKRSA